MGVTTLVLLVWAGVIQIGPLEVGCRNDMPFGMILASKWHIGLKQPSRSFCCQMSVEHIPFQLNILIEGEETFNKKRGISITKL